MAEWNKRLESQIVQKQELNQVVLNYLIFEGYESTATKFGKEIGINLQDYYEMNSINFRKKIKNYLLNGEIQIVIDQLKLEYPDLLEKNQFLHFKLLLLHLIEMIKSHKNNQDKDQFIINIIDFAKKKLTNKALKNPKFMEELELTMTLLLYSNNEEINNNLPDKLKELLKFKLRIDISNLINKSILLENIPNLLNFEDFEIIDSKLKKMIKVWLWGEENLVNEKEFIKLEI